jgi:type I restriction enzyme, R subunit
VGLNGGGYVTTIQDKLMENETLKEQAANNCEEQFAMDDLKNILSDIVIDGQDAHNAVAVQLLQNWRVVAATQAMLATIVWRQFQAGRSANAGK